MFGFFMVGAVVGFCTFYFLRQFRQFSPAVLAALLGAAIFGPVALKFLKVLGDNISDYFAGFGTGFFLYAIYVLVIMILAKLDLIEGADVELFAASGPGPWYNQDARDLYRAIEDFRGGEIDKDELVKRALKSGFSKSKSKTYKRVAAQRIRKKRPVESDDAVKLSKNIEALDLEKELPRW